MRKKKVQTIKTIVLKIKRTYFIPVDEADVDCLYYEPTDEEVISRDVEEEVI